MQPLKDFGPIMLMISNYLGKCTSVHANQIVPSDLDLFFLMYVLQNKFQKSTCKECSFVILVLSILAETAIKSSYIPIFLFVSLKQTQHER